MNQEVGVNFVNVSMTCCFHIKVPGSSPEGKALELHKAFDNLIMSSKNAGVSWQLSSSSREPVGVHEGQMEWGEIGFDVFNIDSDEIKFFKEKLEVFCKDLGLQLNSKVKCFACQNSIT